MTARSLRRALGAAAIFLLAASAAQADGDDDASYPVRPIRLIALVAAAAHIKLKP